MTSLSVVRLPSIVVNAQRWTLSRDEVLTADKPNLETPNIPATNVSRPLHHVDNTNRILEPLEQTFVLCEKAYTSVTVDTFATPVGHMAAHNQALVEQEEYECVRRLSIL